ncbi:hypothetical protein [Nocardia puris]|nr:hypothetical protein [Nocardia puris]
MPEINPLDRLTVTIADLSREPGESGDGATTREAAASILAAGWRPPARVIADPADLDALPLGSVILAGTWAAQSTRVDDSGHVVWCISGSGAQRWSAELLRLHRVVTVLWTPEEASVQPDPSVHRTDEADRTDAVEYAVRVEHVDGQIDYHIHPTAQSAIDHALTAHLAGGDHIAEAVQSRPGGGWEPARATEVD